MSYLTKLFKSIDVIQQDLNLFEEKAGQLQNSNTPPSAESTVCYKIHQDLVQFHLKYIAVLREDMSVLLTKKMAAKDEISGENRYKPAVVAKATAYHGTFVECVLKYDTLLATVLAMVEKESALNTYIRRDNDCQAEKERQRAEASQAEAALKAAAADQERIAEEQAERDRLSALHQNAMKIRKLNETQSKAKIEFVQSLIQAIDTRTERYNTKFDHDLSLPIEPKVERLKGMLALLKSHCQPQSRTAMTTLGSMLSQILNNPENAILRSINGENKVLVDKLLHIGYVPVSSSGDRDRGVGAVEDNQASYVHLGMHCVLGIGFSITGHGALVGLHQYLHHLKSAAAAENGSSPVLPPTVFATPTAAEDSSTCKYSWSEIVESYVGTEGGVDAIMGRYIDHGWRVGEDLCLCKHTEPSPTPTGTFPLHGYKFTFLPEPNPESTAEEDLERWSLWYNTLSAYSECFP